MMKQRRQDKNSVPLIRAQFTLNSFKLQLVDDSAAKKKKMQNKDQSHDDMFDFNINQIDPFFEFYETEIILFTNDVKISFDHYDDEDMVNKNKGDLRATVGDLGLHYMERF